MSKKRHKENNQLSLTLEHYAIPAKCLVPTVESVQRRSADVLQFPSKKCHGTSFRERVIHDLMTTRVMVAE